MGRAQDITKTNPHASPANHQNLYVHVLPQTTESQSPHRQRNKANNNHVIQHLRMNMRSNANDRVDWKSPSRRGRTADKTRKHTEASSCVTADPGFLRIAREVDGVHDVLARLQCRKGAVQRPRIASTSVPAMFPYASECIFRASTLLTSGAFLPHRGVQSSV